MKKSFLLGAVFLLATGGFAKAGCTQEEMMKKAQDFTAAMQTFMQAHAQSEPQKVQELGLSMQKDIPALQQKAAAGDMDALCGFYDSWIEKMK